MTQDDIVNKRTHEYVAIIVGCVRQHLPDCSIYLFGSRAKNKDREGSDVDIALDAGKQIEPIIMAYINETIDMSALPVCFDVVDMHNVAPSFLEQIKKYGILWKS